MTPRRQSVVFAPDSFKGSISAMHAAEALAEGWQSVRPDDEIVLRPMADGGEGTLDAFAVAVSGAQRMPGAVVGPDGETRTASWLLLPPTPEEPGGTGVVELASTSGIELLGDRLRPWDADTTGFGEAIVAALDYGVSRLVLGIGSSASTDGGAGMLAKLGARLTDARDRPIARGARGLCAVAHADLDSMRPLPSAGIIVLTDVTSPLLGPRGAAAVFGPQKGLAPEDIPRAEEALRRLAILLPADAATAGAGAAGGTGFALLAWGARLVPGAAQMASLVGLPQALAGSAAVVTGEGSFDGQSADGKAPAHVAVLAAAAGVPVLLAAGRLAADADASAFAASASLTTLAKSSASALADPAHWLEAAGRMLAESFSDRG